MDQKVWSMAVSDTVGLTAFHNNHKNDYMWEQRFDAVIVSCTEDGDLASLRKVYKKIAKGRLDEAALNQAYCANDTVPCISLENVLLEAGKNDLLDAMKGETGLGEVVTEDGTHTFVILKKVKNPEPKKLDEARGQITSDYQTYLEQQWIEGLKAKYPVEVDKSLLSQIKR